VHANAAKCGGKVSCQKWSTFCPKSLDGIQKLLRVKIEKPGAARLKRSGKKKAAA
jgi:hypothetical protein